MRLVEDVPIGMRHRQETSLSEFRNGTEYIVPITPVARRLDRSPATISRELRRNAATRGGSLDYRALTAQWHADRRARRPKRAKLAVNDMLRHYVQDRLAGAVTKVDGTRLAGP